MVLMPYLLAMTTPTLTGTPNRKYIRREVTNLLMYFNFDMG